MKQVDEVRQELTLSHSSANLLRGCEQKYVYYKVQKAEKDPDFDDNQEHFNVGKAVHYILEEELHVWNKETFFDRVEYAVNSYGVQHVEPMIAAMAFKGLQIQKKESLNTVHCEFKIQTEHTLGYVDLIAADDQGFWWIIDLKTSKKLSELTIAKLKNDYQLNLYAAHYKMIAAGLGLDPKKYMGCRYRVITKSTAKLLRGEDIQGYIKRVLGKNWIKGFEVIIPKEDMNPDEILKGHRELWRRAKKLHEGAKAKCDFAHCSSFFRPCEYYSRCHDSTYTDSLDELIMNEY